MADLYEIGYVPRALTYKDKAGKIKRTWLCDRLCAKGFVEQELRASGILVEDERGFKDALRGHLVFPYRDKRGAPIGFAGRNLYHVSGNPHSGPKWRMLASMPRGAHLFGLPQALPHIKKSGEVWLVEGALDIIANRQAGHPNTVATVSAMATRGQVHLLSQLKPSKIVVAADNDENGSGQKGAAETVRLIRKDLGGLVELEVWMPERPGWDLADYRQNVGVDDGGIVRIPCGGSYGWDGLTRWEREYCKAERMGSPIESRVVKRAQLLPLLTYRGITNRYAAIVRLNDIIGCLRGGDIVSGKNPQIDEKREFKLPLNFFKEVEPMGLELILLLWLLSKGQEMRRRPVGTDSEIAEALGCSRPKLNERKRRLTKMGYLKVAKSTRPKGSYRWYPHFFPYRP